MTDHQIEPHLFVVFGATSDLMRRKLLPALYRFSEQYGTQKLLDILGVSRQRGLTDAGFRALAREALAEAGLPRAGQADAWCDACLSFQTLGAGTPEDFRALAARLQALEQETPLPGKPHLLPGPAARRPADRPSPAWARRSLNHSPGWTRLVVEKPFGRDLESAQNPQSSCCTVISKNPRSTGSTTTWARRRSRTS